VSPTCLCGFVDVDDGDWSDPTGAEPTRRERPEGIVELEVTMREQTEVRSGNTLLREKAQQSDQDEVSRPDDGYQAVDNTGSRRRESTR